MYAVLMLSRSNARRSRYSLADHGRSRITPESFTVALQPRASPSRERDQATHVVIVGLTFPESLWTGLVIGAPFLITLVWPAFRFASTRGERMGNLKWGFVFAIATMFAVGFGFDPRPNSWIEENWALILFAMTYIGGALGVAAAVLVRRQSHSTKR
jgi:hypothetical protein